MSNVINIGPVGSGPEPVADRPVTTEMFGWYFACDDVTAWQAEHASRVERDKPKLHAEVVVEISGHRSMMTLGDFVTRIFGHDVASQLITGEINETA